MESVPEKVCPICGQAKPLTNEFWYQTQSYFSSYCKPCHISKIQSCVARSPEKSRAIAKRSAERRREKSRVDREFNEKLRRQRRSKHLRKRCAKWGVSTVEEADFAAAQLTFKRADDAALRAYREQQYQEAKKEVLAILARHAEAYIMFCDAATRRAKYQRRRARECKADGSFTKADIMRLWRMQQGKCYYCGSTLQSEGAYSERYHVDHVLPLVLGGSNFPENLVLACPTCNSTKSGLPPEVFLNSIGRLL